LKAGQFREAFSELSKTVELNGNIHDARLQLGNLYLFHETSKAREQAEKVLEKEPNNSPATS